MARAIKLKNLDYWDSTGITHNGRLLSVWLNTVTIYDSGSNSNGNWIRFNDGTMICWNVIQGNSFDCTKSGGTGRYYYQDTNNSVENVKDWTFPQEFKTEQGLAVDITVSSNAYSIPSLGFVRKDMARGYCVLPYPVSSTSFAWRFIAIGKWK